MFQISFRSLSRHTHTALNSRRTYTWRTYTWRTYTWRTSSLRRDRSAGMALIVPVAAPCGCARYIVFIVFIVFGVDCAIVPVAAPAILSFSMCVLCVYNVSAAKRTCSVRCSKMEVGCATLLARYPPQQALCYTSATEYHAASATEYHAACVGRSALTDFEFFVFHRAVLSAKVGVT